MELETVSKNESLEIKETVSSIEEETLLPIVPTHQEMNVCSSDVSTKRADSQIIPIVKKQKAFQISLLLALTTFGTAVIILVAYSTSHQIISNWTTPQSKTPNFTKSVNILDSTTTESTTPEVTAADEQNVHSTPLQSKTLNFTSSVETIESTTTAGIPTTIRYQSIVRNVLPTLNVSRLEEFVKVFSSFPNRYAGSKNGVAASKLLQSRATDVVTNSNYSGNVSIESVALEDWLMDSVVARIEGSDPILMSEVVVLCAHLDSINKRNKFTGVAPGADDNASGSAVVFEVFKILLEKDFIPKKSIEFHWYSAEEVGLVGSAEIAEDYAIQDIKVVSVLNLDCVGYYVEGNNEIYLEGEYTSDVLNSFLQLAVEEYCDVGHKKKYCGYECSDHASWNKNGVPAALAYGIKWSPYIHTARDMIKDLNFSKVMEFAKLATAYVIEIAEPNNSSGF